MSWVPLHSKIAPQQAKTLFRWVYGDRLWLTRWADATGTPFAMNRRFLAKLDQVTTLDAGLQLFTVARASDGTRKVGRIGGRGGNRPDEGSL